MNGQVKRLFSDDPLSGKLRFKLRTLNNFLFILAIFIPFTLIVVILAWPRFWIAWLVDAVAIALLFYLFLVCWNKRPIWIRCTHCGKKIATNTPWICGSCEAKNENVDDFPFVHRCKSCKVEPKAYQCHHMRRSDEPCNRLIFLTADEDVRNYAYAINRPVDSLDDLDREDFERKKRKTEYKISVMDLNIEVGKREKLLQDANKKPKSPMEKVEASWEKKRSHTIAAAEVYQRVKKEHAEKYANDPDMKEKADQALDEWYENGDWERIL